MAVLIPYVNTPALARIQHLRCSGENWYPVSQQLHEVSLQSWWSGHTYRRAPRGTRRWSAGRRSGSSTLQSADRVGAGASAREGSQYSAPRPDGWWGSRDSNPDAFRHMILNHARLPVPTLPRWDALQLYSPGRRNRQRMYLVHTWGRGQRGHRRRHDTPGQSSVSGPLRARWRRYGARTRFWQLTLPKCGC